MVERPPHSIERGSLRTQPSVHTFARENAHSALWMHATQVDPLIFSLYRDVLAFPILGAMALVFDCFIPKCRRTEPDSDGKIH